MKSNSMYLTHLIQAKYEFPCEPKGGSIGADASSTPIPKSKYEQEAQECSLRISIVKKCLKQHVSRLLQLNGSLTKEKAAVSIMGCSRLSLLEQDQQGDSEVKEAEIRKCLIVNEVIFCGRDKEGRSE